MSRASVTIRHFRDGDPLSDITQLLRRSYQRLADLGLRYTATWQNNEMTWQRLKRGSAYVAYLGDELVGTLTFEDHEQTTGCPWYDRPGVASFHQFAVDPRRQGLGIGRLLLDRAEQAALDCGAQEIALDTAEWAHHLIDLYFSLGYRLVEEHKWSDTNYLSVVLSKNLSSPRAPSLLESQPFLRDNAEQTHKARLDSLLATLATGPSLDELCLGELGDLYRVTGDYKKAIYFLERATVAAIMRGDSSSLHVQRLRAATTYFYASKYAVANFIFKQLLRDVPTHSPLRCFVHQHYGKCLAEQRQFEEARTQFEFAWQIRKDRQDSSELLQSTERALLELERIM